MRSDAYCADENVWDTDFDDASMVCAGGGETDTCGGDSGGPLMVERRLLLRARRPHLVGRERLRHPRPAGRLHAARRAGAQRLGARAGADGARERVGRHRRAAAESATFSATASDGITSFDWDFDGNGTTDATGASVTPRLPGHGPPRGARRRGRRRDGQGPRAGRRRHPARPRADAGTPQRRPATTTPPADHDAARHDAAGRHAPRPARHAARVQPPARPRPALPLRVRFAAGAPTGTAVIEVVRKGRTIGIARTRVVRGGTRRVRVKLTPSGRRLLARGRAQGQGPRARRTPRASRRAT